MEWMRVVVESLSLSSGAIVIAVLSAVVVWLLCSVGSPELRTLWAIVVPFILAFCLYWSPVWLGADAVEYHAWAFAFIIPWFIAGVVPSALVVHILQKRRAR